LGKGRSAETARQGAEPPTGIDFSLAISASDHGGDQPVYRCPLVVDLLSRCEYAQLLKVVEVELSSFQLRLVLGALFSESIIFVFVIFAGLL
jgi:hypothetical protein